MLASNVENNVACDDSLADGSCECQQIPPDRERLDRHSELIASRPRVVELRHFERIGLAEDGLVRGVRDAHLHRVRVPQLFLSGSRDSLARLDLLRDVVASVPQATLHVVEGGDHSLATKRRTPLAGSDPWLDVAARFIQARGRD